MLHGSALAAVLVVMLVVENPVVATPAASAETARAATTTSTEKININTADAKDLTTLSGVGRRSPRRSSSTATSTGVQEAGGSAPVEGVGNGVWEKNRERIVVK